MRYSWHRWHIPCDRWNGRCHMSHLTGDSSHMTGDMLYVKGDKWNMTGDMKHVTYAGVFTSTLLAAIICLSLLQPAVTVLGSSSLNFTLFESALVVQCCAFNTSSSHYSAVQCRKVQNSAVQCSILQCSTIQCSTVKYSSVQCSIVQYKAAVVQCSAAPSMHHPGTTGDYNAARAVQCEGRLLDQSASRKEFWDVILKFISLFGCKSAYCDVLFDHWLLLYLLNFQNLYCRLVNIESIISHFQSPNSFCFRTCVATPW